MIPAENLHLQMKEDFCLSFALTLAFSISLSRLWLLSSFIWCWTGSSEIEPLKWGKNPHFSPKYVFSVEYLFSLLKWEMLSVNLGMLKPRIHCEKALKQLRCKKIGVFSAYYVCLKLFVYTCIYLFFRTRVIWVLLYIGVKSIVVTVTLQKQSLHCSVADCIFGCSISEVRCLSLSWSVLES